MIRIFNAFQLVCLFTAMPYLIQWLTTEPFAYSGAAYWLAMCVYVVMFFANIACVCSGMEDFK